MAWDCSQYCIDAHAGSELTDSHSTRSPRQLHKANPGSTCDLDLCKDKLKEGKRVFRRMFICFEALKKGWKAGCRPLIGLDGSFLKGHVKGEIFVAVGKDASNQIFPIA